MTLHDLEFLVSERGKKLLDELAQLDLTPQNTLQLLTKLRKTYSPEESGAALSLARLREKAVDKFGVDAGRLLFTEDALQQASHPAIRHYRQQIVGETAVLDVCCGIGSDSLSFARSGADVLGLDYDEVRVEMARHNASTLNLSADFEVRDVTQGVPGSFPFIFFDPARRDEQGKRLHHVDAYIPPLRIIRDWQAARIMVKLSPGVQIEEITSYGGQLEFISVAGDLKEALLNLGDTWQGMRATLLHQGMVLHYDHPGDEPEIEISEPGGWLCEPDPALLRSGQVRHIAAEYSGWLLDETIAYFCALDRPETPWVRSWRIIDWMPFQVKRLRAYLRERNIGRITVKKRGSAITPEELLSMLKLKGDQSATVVLTRLRDTPIVLICEDLI